MPVYNAPLRDIRFVRTELFKMEEFFQSCEHWSEINEELTDAIAVESAKFCEEVIAPLYAVGDREGCTLKDGEVTTPTGFKEAFKEYAAGGWPGLEGPVEFGGQGLPRSLAVIMTEMCGTANWAWSMYPGLSRGACDTLNEHGTQEYKETYLSKILAGQWTGTMCLTEPHCGSDLGLLRTKAEPNADGSYNITGTKIWISSGEHDFVENIVHIVLARLPGAPKGTKGISLFIVPKFLPDANGEKGERNDLVCGGLEEKMGIHGNATCVMNFDGAKGFMLGEPNRGLHAMFTFMNAARIGTAAQGVAHAELAYQNSLAHAKDRLQMRALSGAKFPDKEADPIVVHADVRRMLMTQKVFAEGGRMLLYWAALLSDKLSLLEGDEAKKEDEFLSLLTPIAKAFSTERGFEAANEGMQVFGGQGFTRDIGMEQNVRDCRISMIYEGTTGIQSLDLLGRKILFKGGEPLMRLIGQMEEFCKSCADVKEMAPYIQALSAKMKEWGDLTMQIGAKAMENPDEINAACYDYMMFSGYVVHAYLWAQAAKLSLEKIAAGETDSIYQDKLFSTQFFYERILPRTNTYKETMMSGLANLVSESYDPFPL